MRYPCLLAVLGLAAVGTSATAQTIPPVPRSATVPTGIKREIGFFASLNADCTTNGDVQSRLIKQPANGTVELDDGIGYPVYPPANPRYVCNSRQVMGVRVFYTSKDGFTGKDSFETEFFAPAGQDIVWKYSITVK
jgi:hypothetical protein